MILLTFTCKPHAPLEDLLQQSQEFQIELGPCLLLTADTVGGVCVSDVSPESNDGQCGGRHGEVHGHH